MHGAGGGAPSGKCNGAYRHGWCTAGAIAERRAAQALLRQSRAMLAALR